VRRPPHCSRWRYAADDHIGTAGPGLAVPQLPTFELRSPTPCISHPERGPGFESWIAHRGRMITQNVHGSTGAYMVTTLWRIDPEAGWYGQLHQPSGTESESQRLLVCSEATALDRPRCSIVSAACRRVRWVA